MRKEITIPQEIQYLINIQKNKLTKERVIKVYDALLFKKRNNTGYFDVPSSYLEKINKRYYIVMKLFIEYGIIDYKRSEYKTGGGIIEYKKSYNVDASQCMKYKFLIDITKGDIKTIDIDIDNVYKGSRWYNITKKSLIELGLEPRIVRDNFSRRLHTNITGDMKLKRGDVEVRSYKDYCKGYYSIDAVTSQPRLLHNILVDRELSDEKLDYIFDNDLDFYKYLEDNIDGILGRDMAKDAFTQWVNGTGYLDEDYQGINTLFPVATMFIRNYKSNGYKSVCRLLQHKESKIWIDDLLNKIPTEFGLSVHDSLIVKKEDVDLVLEYCKNKYPNMKFKSEEIK